MSDMNFKVTNKGGCVVVRGALSDTQDFYYASLPLAVDLSTREELYYYFTDLVLSSSCLHQSAINTFSLSGTETLTHYHS